MAPSTRACGKMTSSTDMVSKPGLTSQDMRATMLSEESMASAAINGTTVLSTLATGEKIKSAASGSIHGWTGASTKVNGSTTTWREWAFTFGTMEGCTRVSTRMTRSTDSVFTRGLIGAATRGTGTRASSMVLEPISSPRIAKLSSASGKMARESNGSMKAKSMLSTMVSSTMKVSSSRQTLTGTLKEMAALISQWVSTID